MIDYLFPDPLNKKILFKKKNTPTTISVKDLAIGYKNTKVADGINFNSLSGELVGVIGINGIGKSTLLRTLAQLQPALSGTILIKDTPVQEFSSKALASEIGLVLTEPIASKNLIVQELIALGRQPYTNWIGSLAETDKSKISEAIQMLQLEGLAYKKCFQLSDGQLQRAMIARALAQDTAIILMDEPTTHLDLYHKVEILKLLRSISKATGKTILFTSHEIEMMIQLCDKLVVLKEKGNAFGTPDQLIQQGAFDTLFPSDTISFNPSTRTFRIQK